MPITNDIMRSFLEENPDLAYGYYTPKGTSYNFANYYKSQFTDTYQKYMNDLLNRMAQGMNTVDYGFTNFMDTYNPLTDFEKLPWQARGARQSPRAVWNIKW